MTCDTIISRVGQYYRVSTGEIRSKSREARLSHPRHVAMFLCRAFTREKTESIAQSFNRSYTDVSYAKRIIIDRIATEPRFAAELLEVAQICTGRP
jgi:chromosomal replication initiator protein